MMETVRFSETQICYYLTTQSSIPEGSTVPNHRRKNLKSYELTAFVAEKRVWIFCDTHARNP
jgi:hypothetical protein